MLIKDKILILGIGSPFADDQLGWLVADKLAEIVNSKNIDNIIVESVDRPGLNLLNYLDSNYNQILLIDAVYAKSKPGTIYHLKASQILSFDGFLSSHSIGVSPSLALANALNMDISNIEFYGAEGERLNEKDDIVSDVITDTIDVLTNMIITRLSHYL